MYPLETNLIVLELDDVGTWYRLWLAAGFVEAAG